LSAQERTGSTTLSDASAHDGSTGGYQFGDLQVDTRRQSVSRNGEAIPLPRLSYELLLALLRAHPRMLSNEDLLTSVWAPTVVNPETVGQRIKLLRKALGDDPRNPRYLVSIHGRGYRLVAPVLTLPASEAPPTPAVPEATKPGNDAIEVALRMPGRIGWLPAALGAVIVTAVLVGVGLWYWRVTNSDDTSQPPKVAVAALAAANKTPAEESIVVLPFLDLSEQKDEGYFADGVTEEVTSVLAQVRDLRVSARTSAFYFKDRATPVGEIGKTLGVANILEGSVRKSGDRVRVTAQLIRADTGYHLWSGSYERGPDDLFSVQTEIARAVVDKLKVSLLGDSNLHDELSANTAARTLYFQSIGELNLGTRGGVHHALEHLRQAVAQDPNFAQAWALLAGTYTATITYDDASVSTVEPLAMDAANRALQINPSLAEAHAAKARLLWVLDSNIGEALPEIRKALDADPNHSGALQMSARLQMICGHSDESVRLAREVVSRDPLVAKNYAELADKLFFAGQLPEAVQAYQTAIALNPGATYGRFLLAVVQLAAGDAKAGLASVDQGNDAEERQILRPVMLDALGQHAEAEREQRIAERKYGPSAAADLAIFYAYRGDADHAMAWLEQAFQNHDAGMLTLQENPLFAKLRSDPRFQALLRRRGIPDPSLCH
jgi:TolB-like protein/DNA-binding winged helix-turn-helix (wHTH) protein/Flp pilus assembly protein TadD